jgi:hypothetical protein
MRTKSAYRPKADGGPAPDPQPDSPSVEVMGEAPAVTVETIPAVTETPISEPERDALNKASAANAATEALKTQIKALKRGEEMQRQALENQSKAEEWAQKGGPTREDLLDHWTAQGMAETERRFMERHPELIDNVQVTQYAAAQALRQGHTHGTDAFNQAVLENFHRHVGELEEIREYEAKQSPEFFQPEPQPAPQPAPRSERPIGAIVSAPVSREAPSAGDGNRNLNRIHLSTEERMFARTIGLTEQQYALQKRKMLAMQDNGEIQR